MSKLLLALALVALSLPAVAQSKPPFQRRPFEGVWAEKESECRDEEGPNTRTMIDLREPKVGPLFDQYENHCRVVAVRSGGQNKYVLRLSCHEFWEDFEKRRDARAVNMQISVRNANSVTFDGVRYQRCIR